MILTHSHVANTQPFAESEPPKLGCGRRKVDSPTSQNSTNFADATNAPITLRLVAGRPSTRMTMSVSQSQLRERRATAPTALSPARATARLPVHRHQSVDVGGTTSLDLKHTTQPLVVPSPLGDAQDICERPQHEHVIKLSAIEHCMARAYIRVCLAYRIDDDQDVVLAAARLNTFVHRLVESKPYLSGYIVLVDKAKPNGPSEIRFTTQDFEHYPVLEIRELCDEAGRVLNYHELDAEGFPPSKLKPKQVAVLDTEADEERAAVLRVQANVVRGGLIVSFYLHHCLSDGQGLDLLISGSILNDEFSFKIDPEGQIGRVPTLSARLEIFANYHSIKRQTLSYSNANKRSLRNIKYRRLDRPNTLSKNSPGKGCVFSFKDADVESLRAQLTEISPGPRLTRHDALSAWIWRSLTRARAPTLSKHPEITTSKLCIPIDVRTKIEPNLPKAYFGAAVDFAVAEHRVQDLYREGKETLATAARKIRASIENVDDDYVRETIALANSSDPTVDVRDLLANNMNRVTGADMYITSWEKSRLYEADLGMGFGHPQWVRKPWSRDPGSCIILPRNPTKSQYEVVIQTTTDDMGRLLADREFMALVDRVVDADS